jgi:hypothetical protein
MILNLDHTFYLLYELKASIIVETAICVSSPALSTLAMLDTVIRALVFVQLNYS